MKLSEANAVNALLSVLVGQSPYAVFPHIPLAPDQVERAVRVLAKAAHRTLGAGWLEDGAARAVVDRLLEQGYFALPEDDSEQGQVSPTPTGAQQERATIYVSVGNSDDKLKQMQWALLIADVKSFVDIWAVQKHGEWFSAPNAVWQNACWCFEVHLDANQLEMLRMELRAIARRWGQDSIALAVVPRVELLEPEQPVLPDHVPCDICESTGRNCPKHRTLRPVEDVDRGAQTYDPTSEGPGL